MVETTIQPPHGPQQERILLLGRKGKLTNSDILVVPVSILEGLLGKKLLITQVVVFSYPGLSTYFSSLISLPVAYLAFCTRVNHIRESFCFPSTVLCLFLSCQIHLSEKLQSRMVTANLIPCCLKKEIFLTG